MTDAEAFARGFDLRAARWYAGKARTEAGRRVAAAVPAGPGQALVVEVAYDDDDGPELYLIPIVDDGGLREAVPGDGVFAALAGVEGEERPLGVDQTNTSVVVGDAVVKAYRRLEPGGCPELEVVRALTERGFDGVPALRGAAVHDDPERGRLVLAVAQQLVPDAPDGWESLIAPLEEVIAGDGDPEGLAPELQRVGRTAGRLHAELAAAFGVEEATDAQRAGWRDRARDALADALRILPHPLAAELESDAPRIRVELERFTDGPAPPVTRVHGDLHIAQFLRTPQGVFVVDFEGEPTRPLAERLAPSSPLRDLACLVRSLDHVARSAQVRAGSGESAMDEWIRFAQETVLDAYADGLGDAPLRLDRALLRLFCLEKELYEFTYAARVLPEWLYAPQLGMRWLMRDDAAL